MLEDNFKIVALCAANGDTDVCQNMDCWYPYMEVGSYANCHYMLLQLTHIDLQAQIGCCKLDNSQVCTNVMLVTHVLTTCLVSLVVVNYQCFLLMSCITVVFVSVLLSGLPITVRIFIILYIIQEGPYFAVTGPESCKWRPRRSIIL